MTCQVAAEAADGTEVPYSGAPAVREYGTAPNPYFVWVVGIVGDCRANDKNDHNDNNDTPIHDYGVVLGGSPCRIRASEQIIQPAVIGNVMMFPVTDNVGRTCLKCSRV